MKKQRYAFIILVLLGFFRGFAQDVEYPFAPDIRQFKENDIINPPPRNAILFVGSSSFTRWHDVQDYFPGFTIVNRGFGGSTLLDQIHYAEDIVFPYFPAQIVIYCGENDLASSDTVSPEMVAARFKSWFSLVRSKLPDVKITYISMKPSPSRWHLAAKFMEANKSIREFIESQPNAGFVNIWDSMLDINNQADSTLFLDDMLHMNSKGYEIWQKAIKPELINLP
jgi:lysophospholipase L1-like esterase